MNATQIGAIVVIAMDALSCAYDVANGNMTRKEMGVQLTKDIFNIIRSFSWWCSWANCIAYVTRGRLYAGQFCR